MDVVLTIALPFFALIFTGMVAGRTALMPAETIAGLNTFVFFFALPALLLTTTADAPVAELTRPDLFLAWLIPGLSLFAATFLVSRVLGGSGAATGAIRALAATFPNVGFVGLPLVIAALGREAAPAAAVVIVIDSALMIALATAIIEVDQGPRGSTWRAARVAVRGVVRNPLVLAAVSGVTLSALAVSIPAPVLSYLELLGAAAGPAALFALGASLARRSATTGRGPTAALVGLKLGLHPLLVAGCAWLLGLPAVWQATLVILAALPTAANVYVLAQRYGSHVEGASAAVLHSTVLAVVTVSLVLLLLGVD